MRAGVKVSILFMHGAQRLSIEKKSFNIVQLQSRDNLKIMVFPVACFKIDYCIGRRK